jgi:hypothetical protein
MMSDQQIVYGSGALRLHRYAATLRTNGIVVAGGKPVRAELVKVRTQLRRIQGQSIPDFASLQPGY